MIAPEQTETPVKVETPAEALVIPSDDTPRCSSCSGVIARVKLPAEMRAFWWVALAGVALAVVIGWLKWRSGMTIYNWNPLSDPLLGDLEEYPGTYTLLHTRAFFFNFPTNPWPHPMWNPVAYPPFAAAVMVPLYAFPIPELLFLIVSGLWVMGCVAWAVRKLMRAGIAPAQAIGFPLTVALASFPIARLIHQGNVEIVLWMLTAVGVWAWWRGWNNAAAVLWGLAAAMKLFPIVLLALLLPRKKWRAFAEGVATFVLATIWALWWLGPTVGVAWRGSMKNVFRYQSMRVSEWTLRELVANHSWMELAKMLATMAHFPLGHLALPYYTLGAVALAWAFFGRLWRMPAANQLLAISVFMMGLPTISYYHALVHLYAPLTVLCGVAIQAARAGVVVPGLKKTMLMMTPLFVPFTVLTFPRVILFCGLVQAVVLLALFGCAVSYRFEVQVAKNNA